MACAEPILAIFQERPRQERDPIAGAKTVFFFEVERDDGGATSIRLGRENIGADKPTVGETYPFAKKSEKDYASPGTASGQNLRGRGR